MRKSTVFLFAYAVFLFVAVLLDFFTKEGVLSRLAVAVAIASYYFAFADLFETRLRFCEYKLDNAKKDLQSESDLHKVVEKYIGEYSAFYIRKKRDAELTDEQKRDEMMGIIDKGFSYIEEIQERFNDLEDSCKDLSKEIERNEKEIGRLKVVVASFLLLAFLSFFLVFSFKTISAFFEPIEKHLSICAFGMIVFLLGAKEFTDKTSSTIAMNATKNIERAKALKDSFGNGLYFLEQRLEAEWNARIQNDKDNMEDSTRGQA